MTGPDIRIGSGFDLHRLEPGRPFRLAGVDIDADRGPVGHSDGDVLVHALVDAVLGASGAGDIGELFPDTDPQWKGADSAVFLEAALARIPDGWQVAQADLVLMLERPKLGSLKARIRERVAGMLSLPADRVNVKAKTFEGLGPVGEGAAVAATATVLLWRPS